MTWIPLGRTSVNVAGVVMATVGAGLLWYFIGDVLQVNKKEILSGQPVTLTVPNNSTELRRRLHIHTWVSRLGLFLTLFGGALQVASNYVPE
jgi:hypothetical protein